MSATVRRLEFGVTVEDSQHWTPEDIADAERDLDGGAYDDWAVAGLEQAMAAAGDAFIAAHPDRFRSEGVG